MGYRITRDVSSTAIVFHIMDGNTTATCLAEPRRRRAALAWGLVLAGVLAAGLAGCSTARQREAPVGPTSLLRFRDPAIHDYLRHAYRTGNLYLDFRPALVVDAIVQDRQYRALWVRTLKEQFLLSEAEVSRLQAEQAQEFANHIDILVFTYEGTNEPSPLHKENSLWRLLLRDDDGQLQAPLAIERIRPGAPTYVYLEKYFFGLDRWSQVYRVRFPKLSKGRLGRPPGDHPVELIVTGVKGTVVLQWEDPAIFYANGAAETRG